MGGVCSLKIFSSLIEIFATSHLPGSVVPPPLTTYSGIVSCASSCCTLKSSWPRTDTGCPVYVRRFTSVCCSGRHFRNGELFTVSSLTIDTAAPVSISIVSVCPSTSIVVCNGLLLQPSTGNSEYSVLAGSLDSWLTPSLLALGSGFAFECLPGTDLQTLAMWPCFPHE